MDEEQVSYAWVGFHEEGIPALSRLIETGRPPVCAVTLTKESAQKRSARADVSGICSMNSIPFLEVVNVNEQRVVDFLASHGPEILFVIGWSQILSPQLLSVAKIGTVGSHASYLPHNRGSAPINWSLINGERTSGNSLMWLAEGVDDGDIIDQTEFAITPYDTCATLYRKVAESNRDMILEALSAFDRHDYPRHPQIVTSEPILSRRRPKDGLIDWTMDAIQCYDFVRALTKPYPGAFTFHDSSPVSLWNAAQLPLLDRSDAVPGTVLGPMISPEPDSCGIVVVCGEGVLAITSAEVSGELLGGPTLAERWPSGTLFTDV